MPIAHAALLLSDKVVNSKKSGKKANIGKTKKNYRLYMAISFFPFLF